MDTKGTKLKCKLLFLVKLCAKNVKWCIESSQKGGCDVKRYPYSEKSGKICFFSHLFLPLHAFNIELWEIATNINT